jgi:hypothetical protein
MGLTITPVWGAGLSGSGKVSNATAIENVITSAIDFYETTITNPIDVTIDFQLMSSGLGESNWTANEISYSSYYSALVGSESDANDVTAADSLGSATVDPVDSSGNIVVKTALQAALGLNNQGPDVVGQTIDLNAGATTTGAGSTKGVYNLLAVTEHEIDEVLGLGSSLGENFPAPSAEDLFRYSASGVRSYSLSAESSYLSINGGATDLANFNQQSGGDYGDWTGSPSPQVQDAFASVNSPVLTSSSVEIEALDVIGYTLNSTSQDPPSTPEPNTILMLAGALATAGVARRRRARA